MTDADDIAVALGAAHCSWCKRLLPGRVSSRPWMQFCSKECHESDIKEKLRHLVKPGTDARAIERMARDTRAVLEKLSR